ncbi:sugar kinase [Spirillospora sp. NPDC047279]|uniref:sugar kinase n=1 Tax=Spirillospora sp. NPDC047279 TaxID=3155478 RepID=UPI0033CA8C1E
MTRLDVVGVGEAMVLLQPPPATSLAAAPHLDVHVAGAELNTCASVARLGLRAAFASRVGADPLGDRVLAAADALEVDTTLVAADPDRPTGVFFKDVRPDGRRRVHYYRRGSAASAMGPSDALRILASRPRAIVLTGITVALGEDPAALSEGPAALVRDLVAKAHASGVKVVLDPNLRPSLGSYDLVLETLRSFLPSVDLLALGQDESHELLGVTDPSEVFATASKLGVREVLLKAGPDGVWHADGHLESAADTVVDPVGAGDAMLGGYLAGRLRGLPPSAAAWLGTQLAAAVIAAPGDTQGLPDRAAAHALLTAAATR